MKYLILIFALLLVGCGGSSSDSNIRSEGQNNPPNDPPTDPVDPPTDPVDPPTDPVDPPTDPVDLPIDPDDPSHDTDPPPEEPVEPPTDPEDPVETPDGAIVLPAYWGFYGDSHTAGRGNIASSASPSLVFRNIWAASGFTNPVRVVRDGSSGRSLANTHLAYEGDSFAGTPWIHTQESGGQGDGERTPEEFGDTFVEHWRAVHEDNSGSIKTYETAHSFRLIGVRDRDWQTTENWADWGYLSQDEAISYNAEMLRRIAILAEDDIVVIPVYTAEYVDALIARIPGGYPSIEQTDNPRHYNGTGNFMIALAKFKALGYDVNELDFSSVTIHEDLATDTARKALCVDVINTAAIP